MAEAEADSAEPVICVGARSLRKRRQQLRLTERELARAAGVPVLLLIALERMRPVPAWVHRRVCAAIRTLAAQRHEKENEPNRSRKEE